jgi:hypothetical protein
LEKDSVSRLSYLFAHLHVLSSASFSSTLLSSHLSPSALLCFSSVHILGSFISKLPSKSIDELEQLPAAEQTTQAGDRALVRDSLVRDSTQNQNPHDTFSKPLSGKLRQSRSALRSRFLQTSLKVTFANAQKKTFKAAPRNKKQTQTQAHIES